VRRTDLVAILAQHARGSRGAATRALDAFLGGIRDGLRQGGTVTISGFGTFVITRRATRGGRDPRTGKAITIPSARVPRFRPSRGLKASLR
jgi:DNA-binding protein HU-beta